MAMSYELGLHAQSVRSGGETDGGAWTARAERAAHYGADLVRQTAGDSNQWGFLLELKEDKMAGEAPSADVQLPGQ